MEEEAAQTRHSRSRSEPVETTLKTLGVCTNWAVKATAEWGKPIPA